MNVACPGCGTKYALLDEKIRGRRVRITCKHCSAPIVVDGTTHSRQPETGTPSKHGATTPVDAPTRVLPAGASSAVPNAPRVGGVGQAADNRTNQEGGESPKPVAPRMQDKPVAPRMQDKPVAPRMQDKPVAPRNPGKLAPVGTDGVAAVATTTRLAHAAEEEPTTAGFAHAAEEPATISLNRTSEKPATVRMGRASDRAAPEATRSSDNSGGTQRGLKVPAVGSAHAKPAASPSPGASISHPNASSASTRPARRAATPRGFRGTIIGVAEPANFPAQGSPAAAFGTVGSYTTAPRRSHSPAPTPITATPATGSSLPLQAIDTASPSVSLGQRQQAPLAPPPASRGPVPRLIAPPARHMPARAPVGSAINARGDATASLSRPQAVPNPTAMGAASGSGPTTVAASAVALERPQPGAAASLQQKPARSMHRTIIGVAAPASVSDLGPNQRTSVRLPSLQIVPPASAAVPQGTAPNPGPKSRALAASHALKRTIIGGLEAPSPLAVESGLVAQQLVPTQTKWLVLFPKQGTAEISEAELIRAYAAGEINRDANVWREGLREWQPLGSVESLLPLLLQAQRSRISAAPSPIQSGATSPNDPEKLVVARAESQAPTRAESQAPTHAESQAPTHADGQAPTESRAPTRSSFDQEVPTFRHSTTLRPARASVEPTPIDSAESSPPAKTTRDERFDTTDADEITRISASPWEVPDVGAKATARLAENAGLPPRQMSIPPTARGRFDELPLDRASRRPDIGPRATVRGQLAALASSVPPAHVEKAPVRDPLPAARIPHGTRMGPFSPANADTNGIGSTVAPDLSVPPNDESQLAPATSNTLDASRLASKRRRLVGRWWFWVLVLAGLFAAVAGSYHTRQPKALYRYLHVRGWDAPIDRTVQRVTPRIGHATSRYVGRPYRAVVDKLRGKSSP